MTILLWIAVAVIFFIVANNVGRWWYYWADIVPFHWMIVFVGPREYMIRRYRREQREMGQGQS